MQKCKILVFLQGTIIMHSGAEGKTPSEIIQQVISQEDSVRDFKNYIPIGQAPFKLKNWVDEGAEICYLSALTENKKGRGDEIISKNELVFDGVVLKKYGFPIGTIYHRGLNENYKDVVEKISPLPDMLIEDDCESIGGEKEMTYPHINREMKNQIHSIVVKEFEGIDHLPNNINELIKF